MWEREKLGYIHFSAVFFDATASKHSILVSGRLPRQGQPQLRNLTSSQARPSKDQKHYHQIKPPTERTSPASKYARSTPLQTTCSSSRVAETTILHTNQRIPQPHILTSTARPHLPKPKTQLKLHDMKTELLLQRETTIVYTCNSPKEPKPKNHKPRSYCPNLEAPFAVNHDCETLTSDLKHRPPSTI